MKSHYRELLLLDAQYIRLVCSVLCPPSDERQHGFTRMNGWIFGSNHPPDTSKREVIESESEISTLTNFTALPNDRGNALHQRHAATNTMFSRQAPSREMRQRSVLKAQHAVMDASSMYVGFAPRSSKFQARLIPKRLVLDSTCCKLLAHGRAVCTRFSS